MLSRNFISAHADRAILLFLLLTAAILRFYNYTGLSLFHDELSAIRRLRFSSFKELIDLGVRVDAHPAGVHVFLYYWVQLFGDSATVIRIPFILAGVFSVYFSFLIGKKWFSRDSGFMAAISLTVLQFPLFYSQLARPYSFGLLFTLMAVWYWTRLLFNNKKQRTSTIILYIVSCTLCMYTHYFSFLMVIILNLLGLFLLKRERIKQFLLIWIAIILLYLPHTGVTLDHLAIGGVEGWLARPGPYWIFSHIYYAFNSSFLMICAVSIIFIFGLISGFSGSGKDAVRSAGLLKFRIISIILFIIPFITGYLYSVYVNAVLQNSVLLFSFPFLLLYVFSFFGNAGKITSRLIIGVFTCLLLYSTLIEKKFYRTEHFTPFKKIVKLTVNWMDQYGTQNITGITDIHPFVIQYYHNYFHLEKEYELYDYNTPEDNLKVLSIMDQADSPYLLFSRTDVYNTDEIYDMIKTEYPYLVKRQNFFNSEISLFCREDHPGKKIQSTPEPTEEFFLGFENGETWEHPAMYIDSLEKKNGVFSYRINQDMAYGPTLCKSVKDLKSIEFKKVKISLWCKPLEDMQQVILVFSIDRDTVNMLWRGMDLKYFSDDKNWCQAFMNIDVPGDPRTGPEDVISVYVWNRSKKSFYVDDIRIRFYKEK